MNKYKVYFEFNGKKMAMEVEASSEDNARYYIEDKLIINSVKLIEGQEPSIFETDDNGNLEYLKNIFGMK